MMRERCATGATRGKSRTGEIQSSKFRVRSSECRGLRTSNRCLSRFSRQSRVSRTVILRVRVRMEKQITMVTFDQVSKIYERGGDRITGLDRVTVEVAKGDFCTFIGPSGCGKSTLLNLVGGLDVPTSGDILLEGRSTSRFTSDDWTRIRRETVGIVFQAFHLIPGLTAAENVAFPLLLRGARGIGPSPRRRGD